MDEISKNFSGHPQLSPRVYRTFEAVYLVLSGYTLFSLSIYFLCIPKDKNGHRDSRQEIHWKPRITIPKICFSNCLQPYCLHHNAQRAMSTLIVLMLLSVLAHVSVDFWAFFPANVTQAHAQCVRHTASGILYIVCIFYSSLFLWVRQRVFYAHPTLRRLANPCLNRFSLSVLFTIVISNIFLFVAFFLLPAIEKKHRSSQKKHIFQKTSEVSKDAIDYAALGLVPYECSFQRKNVYLWIHLLFTLTVIYYQVSLQFLFAYPVMKLRRKRKSKMLMKQVKTPISSAHGRLTSMSSSGMGIKISPGHRTADGTCTMKESEDSNFSSAYSKVKETDNSISCQPSNCEDEKITSVLDESGSVQCKATRRKVNHEKQKRNSLLQKKLRAKNRLKCYVFRCLALSLVCSVSDVTGFLFTYIAQGLHQQETVSESLFTSLTYNTNIIINLFCMLGCYNDWKLRLFPFTYCFSIRKFKQ